MILWAPLCEAGDPFGNPATSHFLTSTHRKTAKCRKMYFFNNYLIQKSGTQTFVLSGLYNGEVYCSFGTLIGHMQ
uniref:Uncharacterized protein n=1 Tax=Romanomermis culicivorax TaxID=13658 RepID=A0A915HK37_ROMCU